MVQWPQLVAGYEAMFRYADEADDGDVRAFYNRFAESTDGFLRASREARFTELLAASGPLVSTLLGFDPATRHIGLMATLSLRPYTRLGAPFRGVFMRDLRALPSRALCTSWRDIYERLLEQFQDLPGLDGARCILTSVHADNRGGLVALRRLGRRGIHYAPVGAYTELHALLSTNDFAGGALAGLLAPGIAVDTAPIDDSEVLAFIAGEDAAYDVADDIAALVGAGTGPFVGARWRVARDGGAIAGCVCAIPAAPYKRYAVPPRLAERVAFYRDPTFARAPGRTDLFGFRVASALDADRQRAVAAHLLRDVATTDAWVCFRDAAWNPLPGAVDPARLQRHTYQAFEVRTAPRGPAPPWRLAWEPLFLS
jgi:hypothetical protein